MYFFFSVFFTFLNFGRAKTCPSVYEYLTVWCLNLKTRCISSIFWKFFCVQRRQARLFIIFNDLKLSREFRNWASHELEPVRHKWSIGESARMLFNTRRQAWQLREFLSAESREGDSWSSQKSQEACTRARRLHRWFIGDSRHGKSDEAAMFRALRVRLGSREMDDKLGAWAIDPMQ